MSNPELALLVVFPILAATFPLIAGLRYENVGWAVALIVTSIEAALAGIVLRRVFRAGRYTHHLGGYPRQYGIELVADGLSAGVVVLIAIIALVVLGYARQAGPRRNSVYSAYLLLLGGLQGVSLTGDVFNLFVFLEITGLATYALVAANRTGRSALAALKYLLIGTVGASLYLVGVGYLLLATGTLNMLELADVLGTDVAYTDPLIVASFGFVAVGLSVKAAVFPLHTWMPDAYAEAPPMVTAYISGLVSTVGAYALARLIYTVYTVEFFQAVPFARRSLIAVATVSIIVGSVLAVMQTDVNRMLAYSSVAQFGMIIAAFGLATEQAFLGGVIHLIGHGLMKSGLFLAVGVLSVSYGARTITEYANLGYRSPITAAAFGVLILGLVGVPPSIGFLGKWYIAWGAVEAGTPIVAAVVLFSTLLTLLYGARLLEALYFHPHRDPTPTDTGDTHPVRSDGGAHSTPDARRTIGMVAVTVVLAVITVALGFAAPGFETLLAPVMEGVV